MKKNMTRSALITSVISLVLCVAMLVGTTFAWFTDSVVSGNNVIAAGNLDVELYHKDKAAEGYVDENTKLFDDVALWEPGAVVYENLTVENKGSLALKYQLALNFTNATETATGSGKTLADVLKVAVVSGGFDGDREAAKALDYNYDLKSFALTGSLQAGTNGTTTSEVYGIVIYWEPGANDNDYNVAGGLSIDLGVELFATQLTAEPDSFDNTYDVDAWEDTKDQRVEVVSTAANVNDDGSASMEVNAAPSTLTNKTVIDAPAGTFDSTDKVEVEVETTNNMFNVSAAGGVVASLDVTMTVNGEGTSADLEDGKYFTVTTYISKGLTNVTVTYTGNDGKAQPINVAYDAATGKLTFQTNHFSNYAVSGEALAYDAANDTALTTVQQIIAANQNQNSEVVIPEANQGAIKEAIDNSDLSDADKQAAAAATAVAKIGNETYATLAEAFAKAEDNATIDVLNNVAVKAAITIPAGKTVVLNLNGKTIAGTNTGTATHNDLFLVKGNLTVKNGTVTQIHEAANMGWNGCTNTFDVTAGGVLNLIDVEVENKGGTDMNFAVHMNNWGEVTLNVTNSVLKATYMPVRVFNSGPDMNNVTIENSTLDGGNHAFWVHNYASADFGGKVYSGSSAAYDETQVAARLNFDIFGNGNTFKSGKDYPVRYGFNTSTYFAADGKQLVIATTLSEVMAAAKKGNVIIDAQGANLGDFNYDGTFGNGTVLKNAKFTYVYGASVNGVATFENCEFVSDHSYSANFSDGSYTGKVIFNNCLFDGWSSFGDAITDVEMNNCTFRKTYNYGILRFYQNAVLTDCTFADSFEGVDTNKTGTNVYLNNCDGIDGKIFNNGSNKGNWFVNGTDISANVGSW